MGYPEKQNYKILHLKPRCEPTENTNYVRPKLCPPVPQQFTEVAIHTETIMEAL